MDIQIDTREKQRAIRKIIKTFDENGVKHFSSKLLVGDYMSLDNPRLIIDRKQNLQELCGNVCQQHERFKKELIKAIDAGIQLVILVEHGSDVKNLEDVWFWQNPRKHEVRWRMINGKREKYVVSAKAVDGKQLYKSMCTIRDRYNVRFEFCEKKDTGTEIMRILSECKDNVYADPQETAEIVKKNYGLAGKRYIEVLKGIGKEKLHQMQKEFMQELKDDEAMQKQSLSLSILLVADKVATDYLFRDGEYITIEQAKTVLINRNDLSDNERCYRYLQDKIAMNNQRFDMDTKVEKWGTLEKGVAIIYNQAFKELCKSGGFSDKAFLSWADRKGLIETQGGRMTKVKKVDGNPIRCVFLRLNDNIDKDGFEPVETMDKYEQEKLPFK